MLTPETEQTDLERSILVILRQMPLAIQQQILVLLQQLQARLTPAGDQSVSCEPKPIQAEIDLDHAINYVLEKNAELLDRLA